MPGLTADVGAAASINEINNIAAFPPGMWSQPGKAFESCEKPDEPPESGDERTPQGRLRKVMLYYTIGRMDWPARIYGSGASLLGTLLQLAVIAGTVPSYPHIRPCLHCDDFKRLNFPAWTPSIENLGLGEGRSEVSRCPGRQRAGTTFRIDHAPLPPAFRPFDYFDSVLACVKVDGAGSVKSVKLISGTGKASLDRQLLRTIGRQWRFAPDGEVPLRPGWQRIRLSGSPIAPVEMLAEAPPSDA